MALEWKVRRITEADLETAATWLNTHFANDPESGGTAGSQKVQKLRDALASGTSIWVLLAKVGGQWRLYGVLRGQEQGEMIKDGVRRTFWFFNLLATQYDIPSDRRLEVADHLTCEFLKDAIAAGKVRDYIRIEGPSKSAGARYARDFLGCEEFRRGDLSYFLKPFMDIVEGPHSRGVY